MIEAFGILILGIIISFVALAAFAGVMAFVTGVLIIIFAPIAYVLRHLGILPTVKKIV